MESPLDGIAFLSRSENRVRVLRAVAEAHRTRHDLREELAISRTTLGRVLNEFEERGLIRSTGQGYTTTPAADAVLAKFVPLLETMEGIDNLGEAIDWLPPPARRLEFRHFRDADVTVSSPDNPAAPFDRGLELLRSAGTYRGLTSTAIPSYVAALREGLVQGRLEFEGVVGAAFLETLHADPERADPWHDFADADAVRVYEGRVPINMHIVDDVVLVWLGDHDEDDLEVYGLLETTDPSVFSWAETLYEDYRADAVPLKTAMLPAP